MRRVWLVGAALATLFGLAPPAVGAPGDVGSWTRSPVAAASSPADAPRPVDTTSRGRPNVWAYVVFAGTIGIVGGVAHGAATGRLRARRRQVPS